MSTFGALIFEVGAGEVLILVLVAVVVAGIAWAVAMAVTRKNDE